MTSTLTLTASFSSSACYPLHSHPDDDAVPGRDFRYSVFRRPLTKAEERNTDSGLGNGNKSDNIDTDPEDIRTRGRTERLRAESEAGPDMDPRGADTEADIAVAAVLRDKKSVVVVVDLELEAVP